MSLKNNENKHELSLKERTLQKLRTFIYRSPLYIATLRRPKSANFPLLPSFLNQGDEGKGRLIMAGEFPFAGRMYKTDDDPWTVSPDDTAWQRDIQRFDWLNHLMSLEDSNAVVKARHLISSWLDLYGVWTPLAWRGDILGQRIVSWALHAEELTNFANETFVNSFKESFFIQASHLTRLNLKNLSGMPLLYAVRAQLYVGLYLTGFEKRYQKFLDRFILELDQQILPDGGHVSRCPMTLVDVLKLSLEVIDVLKDKKIEVPAKLLGCVDRIAPMVRTLRHGDGGLGLFHGGQESTSDEIDVLLEHSNNQGHALDDARHSGFQRIEAGRTIILMDVASPPDTSVNTQGHAAPLSMEMSCGEERLLVNCGAVIGSDANWQEALAATAAHNTLTVDEKNCTQLLSGGGVISKEISVDYKRFEENGQTLIDAKHDGYKDSLGLLYQRSIYMNKTGDDLRVEDKLVGSGGDTYAISLHLHPDVDASIVQDGKAALLKLQSGTGWHLKVKGASLKIKESIYAGKEGELRHTDQIIIYGPLRGEGMSVKWRLSRIGSAY